MRQNCEVGESKPVRSADPIPGNRASVAETSDRLRLLIVDVEDRVKLGDLQEISYFLAKVEKL
jgi:hypothetical protein